MKTIQSWWSRQLEPTRFRKINGWLTVFWILMVPVSILMGWISVVEYVSALSIYALIVGHLSTWSATKVEERQEQDQTEEIVKEIHDNLECK